MHWPRNATNSGWASHHALSRDVEQFLVLGFRQATVDLSDQNFPPPGDGGDVTGAENGIAIGHDDITTFCKCRDDRRDGGKGLGVENGCLCTKKIGYVTLEVHVHVCECSLRRRGF